MSHVALLPKNAPSDGEPFEWKKLGRGEKALIVIMFSVIILVAIGMICMFLSDDTTTYVQDLYVPALDTSITRNETTPFNTSIFVDLKFQRPVAMHDLDYKDSEMILYYGHGINPVAGYRVKGFNMGWQKTVHKMAAMEAPELPWEEAFREVSGGSTVDLVVQFEERILYLDCDLSNKCIRSRRCNDGDVLTAHVAVDASGHMVSRSPIVLR